ncbi:Sialyltransferase-like protein 1, partial [Mucuna pruriens]
MTTMLTREYLDTCPDGWMDYALLRITQLEIKRCMNKTLCEMNFNILLLVKPPFQPQQFRTCVVVGNSGDLLKTKFREEIDSHDVSPIHEKYAKYVGLKRDFCLVVRGAAHNMVPIPNEYDDEVLIIKSVTHREIKN